MNKFEKGKYYVCTPPGENWSDFEGPFDSEQEGREYLSKFVGPYVTPELGRIVLTVFNDDNKLHLVKDEQDRIVNVNLLCMLCANTN
ncbi:MAG: hypothetical protein DWQ19_09500 [Crenarchaeota archaeon]|nr:MAG: hypothetical protein DWQ19_09500 [Thermoproteota archaeon]